MNPRTTLILVVLLAAIGGAWWLTRGQADAPPPPLGGMPDDPVALFDAGEFEAQRITSITITRPGRAPVVIEKQRGRWRMTRPVAFAADDRTVTQFLQTIASYADLGETEQGSREPQAEVTLDRTAGQPLTLKFGQRVGGGMARLTVGEQPARLVEGRIHDFLERFDPTDLLSKKLEAPSGYTTTAFTVTTPDGSTRLEQADGLWFIDGDPAQPALSEPVPGYIDVDGYLNIPNATSIERFEPLPNAPRSAYGLDRPRVRIDYDATDTTGEPFRGTLLIGGPADTQGTLYYATYFRDGDANPVVFVLPADFSVVMAQPTDRFRDPRLFTLAPEQLDRIVVDGDWVLTLTDEEGSIIGPGRTLDRTTTALRDRVTIIAEASAHGYGTVNPQAFTNGIFSITLHPIGGGAPQRVRLYPPHAYKTEATDPDRRDYLAVREGESVGLLIPVEVLQALSDLEVMDIPLERVE